MDETVSLGQLLQRLVDGTASEAERQTLREALVAGRLSLATGGRAVAVGGSVTDTVIVTGDRNFVFKGGDAAALRQALLALYPARLHQLPADLPDFTGREDQIEKILQVMRGGEGQVAISALGGMGGVGKTSLAVHVAHLLTQDFPEAQIVVDLMGTSESPLSQVRAIGRVITAFHPEAQLPKDDTELVGLYRSVLHGKRALIFLDNAKDAAQVRLLLPPTPCGVIVTSRRTIILPGIQPLDLDVLPEDNALELIEKVVGKERASSRELKDIAGWCGCLPLALRTAGSFLAGHPDWTVAEYLEALTDEKERLRHLKNDIDDVEAVLGLSAKQLSREKPELADQWQMLAVFPASFDRQAAAAVWKVDDTKGRDSMSELLAWSLILYDKAKGRYRLHDLMRLVAQKVFMYSCENPDKLTDERLSEAAFRHANYYFELVTPPNGLDLKDEDFVIQFLNIIYNESDNLFAGHTYALANIPEYEEEIFYNIKRSMNSFLLNRGYREIYSKFPKLHRHIVQNLVWMSQDHKLHKFVKLVEKDIRHQESELILQISEAVAFLEDNKEELPYFYPDLFEKCVSLWKQLVSIPYFKRLKHLLEPPKQPSRRKIWEQMVQGQCLLDEIVEQHRQVYGEADRGTPFPVKSGKK